MKFKTLLAVVALTPTIASAEPTRLTYPNAVSIEGFGRGLLYSVDFDRVVSDDFVMGAGFGTAPTSIATATVIPVYANYYFMRDAGSVFVTAGVDFIPNSNSVAGSQTSTGSFVFTSAAMVATFGAGYEYRSDNGFILRATGYGIATASLQAWAGFNIGFAF